MIQASDWRLPSVGRVEASWLYRQNVSGSQHFIRRKDFLASGLHFHEVVAYDQKNCLL